MRHFKCEDEGAYLAYVTEIRDTQKGRKVRPSLRLVVETTGLVRSTKCDGIAGSRHLICVRSSRRTADRVSSDEVTGSAVRRAATAAQRTVADSKKPRHKPRLFWWKQLDLNQ